MKKNMGSIDRVIRIAVALVLTTLVVTGTISGTWQIIAGILAVVFLLTSMVSFCPLYLPFGLSTRRKPQAKTHA